LSDTKVGPSDPGGFRMKIDASLFEGALCITLSARLCMA
jgi:hypothetical protein